VAEDYVCWDNSFTARRQFNISSHSAVFATRSFTGFGVDFTGLSIDANPVFSEIPYNAVLLEPVPPEYYFINVWTS